MIFLVKEEDGRSEVIIRKNGVVDSKGCIPSGDDSVKKKWVTEVGWKGGHWS